MDYIFEPIMRMFAYIPEIIILNIFLIIATYTDCKSMKIYNKFNLIMLITRIIWLIGSAIIIPESISWMYILDCLFGGLILCLAFWIPAAISF